MRALALAAAMLSTSAGAVTQVFHHDAQGNIVAVLVIQGRCPTSVAPACYAQHVIWMESDIHLQHELAHVAGMRHEPWRVNGMGIPCARVTAAGLSGYQVGQLICTGRRGEWVER